jgi:hypothetical protein
MPTEFTPAFLPVADQPALSFPSEWLLADQAPSAIETNEAGLATERLESVVGRLSELGPAARIAAPVAQNWTEGVGWIKEHVGFSLPGRRWKRTRRRPGR